MASPGESMSMSLSTGAKLAVPEGAVSDAVEIGMQRPSDTQAAALVKSLPSDMHLASAPYVLTPHGLSFEQPVELTLPIESENSARLAVAYLENESDRTWEIAGVPEISGRSAKLRVDHFSVWMMVELAGDCVVDADDDLDEAIDEGSCGPGSNDDDSGESVDVAPDEQSGGRSSGGGGAPDSAEENVEPPTPSSGSICGNGVVDLHESCDIAIPTGEPGSCPTAEFCSNQGSHLVCGYVPGTSPGCFQVCVAPGWKPEIELELKDCHPEQ